MEATIEDIAGTLKRMEGVRVERDADLRLYTRFGIGGRAAILADATTERGFVDVLRCAKAAGLPMAVIGGGSNLVVSDAGFDGLVLRYRGTRIEMDGQRVYVEAGAELQDLVDRTAGSGLKGLETLTGIPGWVGAAIYGNAGAYGHTISERVRSVRYFDGGEIRQRDRPGCEFSYRESIFKKNKDWVIFSAELEMETGDAVELSGKAREIRAIRDAKYPPSMRCAGSIFKNCILAQLPERAAAMVPNELVREGKVPSAWFLEQVGAKGERRGDIQIAGYHANLIYNDGAGTADDLRAVIADLKGRVRERFGFDLEEEVQFVGF